MALWMHSSDYEWLHDYVQFLRNRAVREMEEGATMERYAELRGSIQAFDAVLSSPEKFMTQVRAEAQARETEDAA
jgi:hypothetical protein